MDQLCTRVFGRKPDPPFQLEVTVLTVTGTCDGSSRSGYLLNVFS